MKAYKSFNLHNTSVREPIPMENQVKNNDGGYVYALDRFKTMERFLILGSEGGSYYVGEKALTKENALNTIACIDADGKRAVDSIVAISDSGRAVKNDPAIFALALAASAKDPVTRRLALSALPKVCRIPTHLFHFLTYVQQFRGWGRSLKRAVAEWYNNQDVEKLAYSVVKYQSRDGFSNRDALRLAHPHTDDEVRNAIYKWVVDGYQGGNEGEPNPTPVIIHAFEEAKDGHRLVELIQRYNLSREMLPTEALNKPEIWEALLEKMPPHALLRNLNKMTAVGLLTPFSEASSKVADKLTSEDAARIFAKNRVHPVSILIAMKQYAAGHGDKGKLRWTPVGRIVDALDTAFYNAFQYAEPTGLRYLIGLDCSASMSANIAGFHNLTAVEGAAAMAMSVAKVEQQFHVVPFSSRIMPPRSPITPRMRLNDIVLAVHDLLADATNLSLPVEWALQNKAVVDAFIIITDNEANTGRHAMQAYREYRNRFNPKAKLIVMGMTATHYTVADPNDPMTLDVAGFDASAPRAVQEFSRI